MVQTIEIYKSATGAEIRVNLTDQTVWLDAPSIAGLFEVQRPAIVKHIQNIYKTGELDEKSTCSILEQVAGDGKMRKMNFYNLDMIISVGYRVNSKTATQFRQWATQRLKDYLVQGYAINEKRLSEKQMQVETLKTGIRILSRAIELQADEENSEMLRIYSNGLEILDDYDHQELDIRGKTIREAILPDVQEYLKVINSMKPEFSSDTLFVATSQPGEMETVRKLIISILNRN